MPQSNQTEFQFAVVADPHIGEVDDPGFRAFISFLDAIQATPPDFILVAGDLGLGWIDAFEQLLSQTRGRIPPLHVVAGNDESVDGRSRLRELFADDFGDRDFYSFAHKNALFIAMCNAIPKDHTGHFSSQSIRGHDQSLWIAEQMEGDRDLVFLFGHVPPHPTGEEFDPDLGGGLFIARNDQDFLRQLVLKHEPDAMFFGHTHCKRQFPIGSTPVFILPCLNPLFGGPTSEYLHVSVQQDGISTEYITLSPG